MDISGLEKPTSQVSKRGRRGLLVIAALDMHWKDSLSRAYLLRNRCD